MEDDPWRGSGTLLRNRVSAPFRFYGLVWGSLGLGLWLKGEIEILTGGLEFGLWVRKLHLEEKWRGLSNKFIENCTLANKEKLLVRKQA